jgi:IS1 family transposase
MADMWVEKHSMRSREGRTLVPYAITYDPRSPGVSQNHISRHLPTVLAPDANDSEATILELDELWPFVLKKTNQAWTWIALCRKTRQVVANAIGDRREKTCRLLWGAIPEAYRAGHCFTDFWSAYQAGIPEEQHTAVGKETGETAHVERWNNTALATSGSFRSYNALMLKIIGDA